MSEQQAQLFAWKQFIGRFTALFVPDQFASIEATAAGNTDVWVTPNNFLLLGFSITVAGTLAAAGEQIIKLVDTVGDVTIATFNTSLPAVPAGNAFFGQDFGGGYGYLSAPSSTTLAINLGTAMASGHVCVNAWGAFDVFPVP